MRQVIVFNNKNWPLPEPRLYTEYKYLHFTSNSGTSGSLFNSGYYANANTKIVLKCILQISENGNNGQGILGTRASASDSNAWLISWYKTDSTRGRYYGNTGAGAKYDGSSSHHLILTNEITITMTMSTATITNGTTTYTINFGTTSRGTTSGPLILGGWWAGDANKYLSMLGYWGECQIYENDVLLHDFVPCTRNSDSAVGLWDKSTGTFAPPIDNNYIPTPVNSAS